MKRNILVLVIVFISILHEIALGYDDRIAHPKITENAVKDSVLKTYLSLYLGPEFSKEYESIINGTGKSVKRWIMDGSTAEDADACQRANHMHNPMNDIPWSSSYMSDDPWWTSACYIWWYERYSNVTWATGFLAPAPDGQKASYYSPPPQNWDVARRYYYRALTSDLYRTLNFARTFKTIGQILHLLQDMAVPAHTRNDFTAHIKIPGGEPYESYVQANSGLISASAPAWPVFDTTTLTKFWDTNKYDGTNPSAQPDIGLAEFTNANYFSLSTIRNNGFENGLRPEHYFPYPYIRYSSSVGPSYQICSGLTDSGHEVQYISRKNGKPCPPPTDTAAIDHFAVMTLVNADTSDSLPTTMLFWLDNNVYRQYAKELLPRAIGYSAGLLNYFFRGTLEITAPDRCVYSLIDGAGTQQFTKIKAKVKNKSYIKDQAGNNILEEIKSGTLQAIASYKIRTDYSPDLSNDPPNDDSFGAYFSYSVSSTTDPLTPDDIDALNGTNNAAPKEFTFNFTNSPIPAGITDLYIQVVFKGTLGNEADNAIAVGFKDLSEPTHINLWNTTDYVYSAGQLRAAEDSEKVTLNERIAFCPSQWPPQDVNDYQVQYMPMEPGQFGRIIFISDPGIQIFYGVTDTPVNDPNPTVANDWYLPWTTVYQDKTVGANTHVYEFRGKAFHEASGYYNSSVSVPDAGFWLADWPAAQGDAIPAANLNW